MWTIAFNTRKHLKNITSKNMIFPLNSIPKQVELTLLSIQNGHYITDKRFMCREDSRVPSVWLTGMCKMSTQSPAYCSLLWFIEVLCNQVKTKKTAIKLRWGGNSEASTGCFPKVTSKLWKQSCKLNVAATLEECSVRIETYELWMITLVTTSNSCLCRWQSISDFGTNMQWICHDDLKYVCVLLKATKVLSIEGINDQMYVTVGHSNHLSIVMRITFNKRFVFQLYKLSYISRM